MLSDATLAEDAAQDIFIKAYQALGRFQAKSSFSTWLYRIATNHCLDLLRKRRRYQTESWEALLEKDRQRMEALFSVSSEHLSKEYAELLKQLLSHLSVTSRTILVLREIEGLTYEEIANTLQCSLDAVKSRLKRARQEIDTKLRHILKSQDV